MAAFCTNSEALGAPQAVSAAAKTTANAAIESLKYFIVGTPKNASINLETAEAWRGHASVATKARRPPKVPEITMREPRSRERNSRTRTFFCKAVSRPRDYFRPKSLYAQSRTENWAGARSPPSTLIRVMSPIFAAREHLTWRGVQPTQQ